MSEALWYGIGGLLLFFTVSTFVFSRIKTNIYPEEYEFGLDPCWYVLGIFLIASLAVYFVFPTYFDMIKTYSWVDFVLPVVLAVLLYFFHLLDVGWLTWSVTFAAALGVSFMQPDDFILFPTLSPWQDKVAVAAIITLISFGLGLLNGMAALASIQFTAVMMAVALLAYFGIMPQLLGAMALTYMGIMLAFLFLSWPPEKLAMNIGGFSVLGFVLGCFMLNGAAEYSEASMFIAVAYMAVEIGMVLYNRFIKSESEEYTFMYTAYYHLSNQGEYEKEVAFSLLKLMGLNVIMAMVQTAAHDLIALPIFTAAINLWYLSILSGDTKPEELLSISKWGIRAVKGVVQKKRGKKETKGKRTKKKTPEE